MERKVNFGAGPAMLPDNVLMRIRDELMCLPNCGSSILEISHRSQAFRQIMTEAETLLRQIVGVPDSHSILFLQGGSRLQFSVAPLNFASPNKSAAYLVTGAWSKMAADEARRMAEIDVFWTGEARGFCDLPAPEAMPRDGDWSYVYFASNETIHGVQFRPLPTGWSSPLVCDMSSDFLSRPISVRDYAMLFACAQKNAGIAGLTIVIVDRNRLREVAAATPGYLNLKSHIRDESLYNTPPTFAIYVLKLMLEWIRTEFGDLPTLEKENLAKAALVYGAIDQFPQVYRGHAHRNARSAANVSFYLPNEDDLARFLAGAAQNGMTDLRGHRTLGGVRVSLYNAIRKSTVQRLVQYMEDFARG